ncbi:hypothetical protein QW131_12390 [Roseibium salinum]|nr:hypothetical protein [Roseibium salinum]
MKASGGGSMQTIRFAVLPQALPVILSIILYNFEIQHPLGHHPRHRRRRRHRLPAGGSHQRLPLAGSLDDHFS